MQGREDKRPPRAGRCHVIPQRLSAVSNVRDQTGLAVVAGFLQAFLSSPEPLVVTPVHFFAEQERCMGLRHIVVRRRRVQRSNE